MEKINNEIIVKYLKTFATPSDTNNKYNFPRRLSNLLLCQSLVNNLFYQSVKTYNRYCNLNKEKFLDFFIRRPKTNKKC